jgi:WD40 repeat protein
MTELSRELSGDKRGGVQLFGKLTGSEQLWWRCCREAAQMQPYWLLDDDHDRALQVISSMEPARSRGVVSRAATAADLVCRALAEPASRARPPVALNDVVKQAAGCWDGSPSLLIPEGKRFALEAAETSAVPHLRDQLRRVLVCLDNVTGDVRQAMVAICALLLAADEPDLGRVVRVRVVFARPGESSRKGVAGTLELREFPPGPAGLFPDPRGMRNRRGDPAVEGLRLAWRFAAGAGRSPRCVLWRLSLDGGVPDYAIDGGSLGAAFAVGLRELLRRPRGSRWGVLEVPLSLFVGLRPRCAITGVLVEQQPTGYERKAPPGTVGPWLGKVGDWDAKLEAAKAKGLRLIAPAANESDSGEGGVVWAYTAHQADRYARQVRPVRTGIAAAAILAVLGAAAGIGIVAHARSGESSADAQAAQQHDVALSRQLAAQSLSLDTTDPLTARQLAVAAWSVSHTSQAESAMTALLIEQQRNGTLPLTSASAYVQEVALSPDGKLLATVKVKYASSGSGTVQLWNLATRQPVGKPLPVGIDLNGDVDKVAFSPAGTLLATANTNGTVSLWNPANGRRVGTPLRVDPHGGTPDEVAFSPDGKLLATSDTNGTVRAWNVASGQPAGPPLRAETGSQGGLAFSPDNKLLATADSEDGTVQLWNPVTGQLVGAFLATASVPNNNVGEVAFSPDGKLLITADGIDGTVSLWNPVTTQLARVIPRRASADFYSTLTFSLHGEVLTVDEASTARSWNIATGRPVGPSFRADVGAAGNSDEAAISPNGQVLAAAASNPAGGGSVARLWNLATRQPVGAPLSEGANSAYELAFSPNGKLLAAAETDGTVQLRDTATGQPVGTPLSADTHDQAGMAFSPDGKLLATADNTGFDSGRGGGIVRLWNPSTGKPAGAPLLAAANPRGRVNGLVFSPDSKFLATVDVSASGQTVQRWNPATGQPVGSAFPVDSNSLDRVAGMAFSPDGKLLAIAEGDI